MSDRITLYTDENVDGAVIAGLRQRGVDIMTTLEAGMLGATDEAHLTLATSMRRAILTRDSDFLRLTAAGVQHSGIIFFRQPMSVGEVIRNFMLVYESLHLHFCHPERSEGSGRRVRAAAETARTPERDPARSEG